MSTTENALWAWLKKARDFYGKDLHIRRVENAISTGDADVDGVLLAEGFALELKACERPRRETVLGYHEVTLAQVEWHDMRLDAGGASGFLIQVGSGREAARYVVHARHARALRRGVTESWLRVQSVCVDRPPDAIVEAVNLIQH